jgi:hypothetical protein
MNKKPNFELIPIGDKLKIPSLRKNASMEEVQRNLKIKKAAREEAEKKKDNLNNSNISKASAASSTFKDIINGIN